MKFINEKQGVELSLQTIAIFIIVIIALIIIIVFFTQNYTSNSDALVEVGKGAIDAARNGS